VATDGPSFHDPDVDPHPDIDDSDRHREDILTGQTDLWDAVDAEMDYHGPFYGSQKGRTATQTAKRSTEVNP